MNDGQRDGVAPSNRPCRIGRPVLTLGTVFLAATLVACSGDGRRDRGGDRASGFVVGPVASPVGVLFAAMDRDGDRVVSAAEATDGIALEWSNVDGDNDARASLLEIAVWAEASLGNEYALPNHMSFDANLDGSVSKSEFSDHLMSAFGRLDTDQDSVLKRSEIVALWPATPSPRGQRGRGPGGDRDRTQRPQGRGPGGMPAGFAGDIPVTYDMAERPASE